MHLLCAGHGCPGRVRHGARPQTGARLGQYKVVDAVTGGPNPTQGSWGCREGELGFPDEAVCLSCMFKLRSGKEALRAVSARTVAKEA